MNINPTNTIVDKATQDQLTPDVVLADLVAGNERFVSGNTLTREASKQVEAANAGQWPKAAILSCIDSRVPVEMVFDQSIGDVFVGRVAGNVESENMLGSLEYATKVVGVKIVLVLGHSSCGAVKAAIDDVKLGNITGLLANITPAVAEVGKTTPGDSSNGEKVAQVVAENVKQTIARIRQKSPIMKELEEQGAIKIVGGVYDLKTGKVNLH